MNSPLKHLPAPERRALTVETVIALAAEQNPSEITTASIAKRMGLTQGAIFRHFSSKEAILEAVMEWVAEKLLSKQEKVMQEGLSPLAALEAIFMAHIDFVVEHPGVPRILFGELQRGESTAPKRMAQSLIRRYAERVQQLLEAGKECGEVDTSLESEAGAILFIGTVQGLVMQSLLAGDVGRIRLIAPGAFAIFRRGIGRPQ
ncbi:MAG: TetR/AcrR family transcriptional regulator [Deltaproteobacteria bacterium]|nr:TetR/AcrR family transcriptional regulator [Deltaproteobacteria bacterium]TLN05226.1 MAG: TetR/AcrR family transcriptional regulator [bacterium]